MSFKTLTMRAKTLVELLTLSTNLYILSKDEQFMKNVTEITKKGKQKLDDFMDGFSEGEEEGDESLIQKVMQKAQQAKEEFEKKMEEVAVSVYKKMHLAHSDDLQILSDKIESLEMKISIIESKISDLETKNK